MYELPSSDADAERFGFGNFNRLDPEIPRLLFAAELRRVARLRGISERAHAETRSGVSYRTLVEASTPAGLPYGRRVVEFMEIQARDLSAPDELAQMSSPASYTLLTCIYKLPQDASMNDIINGKAERDRYRRTLMLAVNFGVGLAGGIELLAAQPEPDHIDAILSPLLPNFYFGEQ